MAQNTAQAEAMQAVRLLYRYAARVEGVEHEALYRARQVLEGFIEGNHALELSTDDEDMTYSERPNTDEWYSFSCDGVMVSLRRENRK